MWKYWHLHSIFKHSFILHFHWIIWFLFQWKYYTPMKTIYLFGRECSSSPLEPESQPLSLGLSRLFSSLASHPSTLDNNVQFVNECMHSILLVRHTFNKFWNLDYDKIPIHYVPFTLTLFNGDVTFELPTFLANIHNPCQMQSMDKKYDGHVWCNQYQE